MRFVRFLLYIMLLALDLATVIGAFTAFRIMLSNLNLGTLLIPIGLAAAVGGMSTMLYLGWFRRRRFSSLPLWLRSYIIGSIGVACLGVVGLLWLIWVLSQLEFTF
ncbi:MAG TPA: hypothetical protein VKQ34_04005 [Candidatus Saccharimonadales bacterium]|nr:hypothetical protein [Candidatus Saccharimonadales bacterium]